MGLIEFSSLESTKMSTTVLCQFSGLKIYPGHGKRMIRIDNRSYNLLSAKCEALHLAKKNPRKISWTVLYRRKHKKGTQVEVSKRRTRRNLKNARAIQGSSWTEILAKRNQKPEIRKAQRDQAVKDAKAKKKSEATKKSANRGQQKEKIAKQHKGGRANVAVRR